MRLSIDRGISRKEVADLIGVSLSSTKRWLKRRRQTGDVNVEKIPGRPSVKCRALREWLPEQLESNPDLTLKEDCEAFEDELGMRVSEARMSRNIARLFLAVGRSKKSQVAQERDEGARGLFGGGPSLASILRRLVFVDEGGFHTSMMPSRSRAPRGELTARRRAIEARTRH